MRRIETSGNVMAIFYPQESDSTVTDMLNTNGSFLNIYLKDNKMEKMVMWPNVKGKMYPLGQLTKENMFLQRYIWYGDRRPIDKDDIYRRIAAPVVSEDDKQRRTSGHKFNL